MSNFIILSISIISIIVVAFLIVFKKILEAIEAVME